MVKLTTDIFIERASRIHNNKYNYSKVNYVRGVDKVCIICPVHGEFWQAANTHLQGGGCMMCGGHAKRDKETFIKEARKIHGNKYDYSKVDYINNKTPVCIICPKHGDFWQTPRAHLCKGHGCPLCNESNIERDIRLFLTENNILYETQKTWDWLVYNSKQYVDYYLPDYDIVIECQGRQHFEPPEFFNKDADLKKIQDRDKNKRDRCLEHGITVLYYSNLSKKYRTDKKYNYPYLVYEDVNEILKIILDSKN